MDRLTENTYLPLYKELPDLDLYLDQVLLYINGMIECSDAMPAITSSMINNYVKLGFIEKPVKKKYRKSQVARLISISLLKNIFSINDIAKALNLLEKNISPSELYDHFVASMNHGPSEDTPGIISDSCNALKLYFRTMSEIEKLENENSVNNGDNNENEL